MTALIIISWLASLCIVFALGIRIGRWDVESAMPQAKTIIDPLTGEESRS